MPQGAWRRKEDKARQPDELDLKIGKIKPVRQLREWSGCEAIATLQPLVGLFST